MKESFNVYTHETVDFIDEMKSNIRDELENGNTEKAVKLYEQMWVIADFGTYTIHDPQEKADFLNLIKTAADDIRTEIRKAQTKGFYEKEDEVLSMFKQDMNGRMEDRYTPDSEKRIIITILGKQH